MRLGNEKAVGGVGERRLALFRRGAVGEGCGKARFWGGNGAFGEILVALKGFVFGSVIDER